MEQCNINSLRSNKCNCSQQSVINQSSTKFLFICNFYKTAASTMASIIAATWPQPAYITRSYSD